MRLLQKILNHLTYQGDHEKYSHQYRLIHYITWELIIVCAVLTTLYTFSKLWYLSLTIAIAVSIALLNLWVLKKTRNTPLCCHILTFLIFLAIIITNYLVWGIGPLHSQWFYVMPLLAASLSGMASLFIYAAASMAILILFSQMAIPPVYDLHAYQFMLIESVNHVFSYIIIVTTLANLIHENHCFKKELYHKNYLLQEEKDKYHYLARFDHLTNLPNRRYFIQHLHEIIDAHHPNYCITVFFIDLDNFKMVNDHYGHNIGDQLLLETSRRLQLCFREEDFIARLGGDEFTATVIHAPNKQIPAVIAQRIIREFDQILILENGIEYHYSLSIGLASYPHGAQTAPDLIVQADLAMYSAKKVNGSSYYPIDEFSEDATKPSSL
ncbi:MAG: GGDEF domain-containing protein [Legionella sp.]|uniref:diguanylate cyclase domain-containing protein n=1 Tax=Legionella sp. TaxID=459 RepID=UPI0039E4883C